ncbi:MAG: hypothetical protein IKA12_03570 [Clostridia bacterium]|nr:hypothetical protein [Clostridia bacterium]
MYKLKILKQQIKRFNKNIKTFYRGRYIRAYFQQIYCALRFGTSFDDFFRYEFYKKSNYERAKYLTYKKSKKIIKNNCKQELMVFSDKQKFNEKFKAYIKREYLVLENATGQELEDFCKKHGSIIMKPIVGSKGNGIFKLNAEEIGKYNIENYRDYIAEELLVQHKSLSKLNPDSVNTIRALTYKGEIVACALRIGGGGSLVDNFSSGGVCGAIDIDSGIVISPCIDVALTKYIFHPQTKAKMLGFEVPNWERVKQTVIEASREILSVEYVGWDLAVLENGVAIIEGNGDPGHRIMQMSNQQGIYNKILEIKKRKK